MQQIMHAYVTSPDLLEGHMLMKRKEKKRKEKKRKVYAVRRHDGSLCTQKQPLTHVDHV